jgi:hypothetical protein
MADFYSNLYVGIPAGLALLVVPTVLIESQWRLHKRRKAERAKARKPAG